MKMDALGKGELKLFSCTLMEGVKPIETVPKSK